MKQITIEVAENRLKVDYEELNKIERPFEDHLEEKVDAFLRQFAESPYTILALSITEFNRRKTHET